MMVDLLFNLLYFRQKILEEQLDSWENMNNVGQIMQVEIVNES